MPDDSSLSTRGMRPRSLTTRRGFIAGASLGAVSLYGLWAAYGAAPFRLSSGDDHGAEHEPAAESGGHGGHGAGGRGPSVAEFRRESEAFVARHRQPDGSVRVDPASAVASAPAADHGSHAGHGGDASATQAPAPGPTDVYLLVQQWSFEPDILRLRTDVPYRFRMMAVDVAHGASLQLGPASRIVRLRPGVPVEQEITFTRPGEYLVYCTLYCGLGHDRMSGRIIVT